MDVGDVCDPDLVRSGRHQAAHEIGNHDNVVWSLRRRLQEWRLALCEKIVLAHEPEHLLGINDHAFASDGRRHAPIAVEWMLEANALELVAQLAVRRLTNASLEMPVIG